MEARIVVSDTDDVTGQLASLRQWLAEEDDLRGRVRTAHALVEPGQMGSVSDALTVVLSNEQAMTVLAASVAVWLRQRRSKLKVKIIQSNGSSQEITASGPAADALAAKLESSHRDE